MDATSTQVVMSRDGLLGCCVGISVVSHGVFIGALVVLWPIARPASAPAASEPIEISLVATMTEPADRAVATSAAPLPSAPDATPPAVARKRAGSSATARTRREQAAASASSPAPAPAPATAEFRADTDDAPLDLTEMGPVGRLRGGDRASEHGLRGGDPGGGTRAGAADPAGHGRDRSRPVRLDPRDWSCEWPDAATADSIDEEHVVLRVQVRADGTVERAQLVSDPGRGFGVAAVACARKTRFQPALDAGGRAIAAASPDIRVRFSR